MDSKKAIEYITNWDWRESRLGLERMEALLARLGNPHLKLKYVHVAGTNGKGSVCAMLASVLVAAGYRTGLYTSPYINCFNERIQIDGQPIDDKSLAEVTARVQKEADMMPDHPTEFELITVIAFQYFHEAACDIVVLEVGLGGRLDATNIIPVPEVAVIAPISLDHVRELGDTIEKIAAEKAGIIKQGCHVVSSAQTPGVAEVLRSVSRSQCADIAFMNTHDIRIAQNTLEGQRFNYKDHDNLEISLLGAYQPQNASVVALTVEHLREKGWSIDEASLHRGLADTRWPARFEIVQRQPWVVVEGGHNPQCADSMVDNMQTYFPGKQATFVIGVMADKDFRHMFGKVIPLAKRIFTVTPNNPRALSADELARYFQSQGVLDAIACESIEQGVKCALESVSTEEVVCVFGSFYIAGAVRKMFRLV